MKAVLALVGVVALFGSARAQIEAADPLECSQEEYAEALRMVPRGTGIFYKPLLTRNFNELRNTLANENTVRWHVDCILYDKACTSLGKAMQYFVSSQSGGQPCSSCETTCLRRRLKVMLQEIHCTYPLISEEVKQYFLRRDKVDVVSFYLGNNPTC